MDGVTHCINIFSNKFDCLLFLSCIMIMSSDYTFQELLNVIALFTSNLLPSDEKTYDNNIKYIIQLVDKYFKYGNAEITGLKKAYTSLSDEILKQHNIYLLGALTIIDANKNTSKDKKVIDYNPPSGQPILLTYGRIASRTLNEYMNHDEIKSIAFKDTSF